MSLFLVGLWESIFSVYLVSTVVFSGYWLKQHLNQTDLRGYFSVDCISSSSPLPVCWNSCQSCQLCLLRFPLVLLILRLCLAQNLSEHCHLSGQFLLTFTWATFSRKQFPTILLLFLNWLCSNSCAENKILSDAKHFRGLEQSGFLCEDHSNGIIQPGFPTSNLECGYSFFTVVLARVLASCFVFSAIPCHLFYSCDFLFQQVVWIQLFLSQNKGVLGILSLSCF